MQVFDDSYNPHRIIVIIVFEADTVKNEFIVRIDN